MSVNESPAEDMSAEAATDNRRDDSSGLLMWLVIILIALGSAFFIPAYLSLGNSDSVPVAPVTAVTDDPVPKSLPSDETASPLPLPPQTSGVRAPASVATRRKPAAYQSVIGPRYVWNYWLTDKPDVSVPDIKTASISLGTPQRLVFRLSDLDLTQFFEGIQSVTGSSLLRSRLAAGIEDPDQDILELEVLVQSADNTRLLISTGSTRYKLPIDLAARRMTLPAVPLSDTTPDGDFLDAAKLAEFGIDFKILTPGSHEVGIVVIDSLSGFPLQSMVVTVSDQSSAGSPLKVVNNGETTAIGAVTAADLALFMFDLASKEENAITRSLHAQLYYREKDGSKGVVSWRADVDMAGLRSATKSFVAATGSEKVGTDLTVVGEDFGTLIFGPGEAGEECDPNSNCAKRQLARSVLSAAADYNGTSLPPTMVIRIIGGSGAGLSRATEVLPFGAMGIARQTGEEPLFLGERFALALILSDHKVSQSATCPSAWRFAIPDKGFDLKQDKALAAAVNKLVPVLDRIAPEAIARQSENLEELRRWFAGDAKSRDKSFVFAFVGHHAENRLYLSDGGGINVGAVKRKFTRASIAILNACSSAIGEVTNGTLVGKLALNGVDTIIATTSPVAGDLAGAYMVCLDAVLDQPRSLTIGQAHALATQCLWSSESSGSWPHKYNYQGAALKYLLIGDPNQLICPPMRKDVK